VSVTNVDVDDEALAAAAEIFGTTTKRDTINTALREAVRRHRRCAAAERLAERAARGDFDPTRRVWQARKAAQRAEAVVLDSREGAE
jgi:Arc/MetJ family transcription regulator